MMAISNGDSPGKGGHRKVDKVDMVEVDTGSPKLSDRTRSHLETMGWEDGAPPKNIDQTIPHRDGSAPGFLPQEEKIGSIVPRGTLGERMRKFARHKDKIKGGKADDKQPKDFNQKELKNGIKVEREHTTDKTLAKEIAMDHLEEFPNYYTALDKMEKKLEKQGSVKLASIAAGFSRRVRG